MEAPKTNVEAKSIGWPIVHTRSGAWMPLSTDLLLVSMGGKEPTEKLMKWKRELEAHIINYTRKLKTEEIRKDKKKVFTSSGLTPEEYNLKELEKNADPNIKKLIKNEAKKNKKSVIEKVKDFVKGEN